MSTIEIILSIIAVVFCLPLLLWFFWHLFEFFVILPLQDLFGLGGDSNYYGDSKRPQ